MTTGATDGTVAAEFGIGNRGRTAKVIEDGAAKAESPLAASCTTIRAATVSGQGLITNERAEGDGKDGPGDLGNDQAETIGDRPAAAIAAVLSGRAIDANSLVVHETTR